MRTRVMQYFTRGFKGWLIMAIILAGVFLQSEVQGFVINVVDDNGQPITVGFRYLIEEDNTFYTVPGVRTPVADWDPTLGALNLTHTIGVDIHRSHAPVVCAGDTGAVNGAPSRREA